MNKISSIICLLLAFVFIASCEREDLSDEVRNAYSEAWQIHSASNGICNYKEYKCENGNSYYCGYSSSSSDLLWTLNETCELGCDDSTGKCKNGSSGNSTDTETSESCTTIDGHMWSSKSSGTMTWSEAGDYCDNLTECGYSDWKLPSINELRTLIKNCSATETGGSCGVTDSCLSSSCRTDPCNGCDYDSSGGYYSKLGDDYNVWLWSSSVQSDDSDCAWLVYFNGGSVNDYAKRHYYYVRCVRNAE